MRSFEDFLRDNSTVKKMAPHPTAEAHFSGFARRRLELFLILRRDRILPILERCANLAENSLHPTSFFLCA